MESQKKTGNQVRWNLIYLLLAALFLRLVLAAFYRGYETDMSCFMGWADRLYTEGISSFYQSGGFNDYPPGYMYVLWLIGALKSLFGFDNMSVAAVLLTKLPAILCDLGAGYLIYRLAEKRFSEKHGLICAALYVFSPAIWINSAMWGQVDAVTTLFMLLVCYFVYEKKMPLAYVSFAIGFLMKPQMAFVFPIMLLGIVDNVFLEDFSWKKFGVNLGTGLASIGGMFLLAMPFGLSYVIPQYVDTVSSYPKATVNAYNFWAMLGLNWHDQTERFMGFSCNTWGTIFILLIFAAAIVFWYKSKKNGAKYFYISAFIVIGIFTLSVRMHERYMFYALALWMCLYALKPRMEFLIAYIALSIVHLINVVDILFYYDAANFDWEDPLSRTMGFCMVVCFVLVCWLGARYFLKEDLAKMKPEGISTVKTLIPGRKKEKETVEDGKPSPIRPSEKTVKLVKWDFLIIAVICVIYGAVALHDLGSTEVPQTGWKSTTVGDTLEFEFAPGTQISGIHYFQGNYHRQTYKISYYDMDQWTTLSESEEFTSVFKWQEVSMSPVTTTKLQFEALSDSSNVLEFVFVDADGEKILPVNADDYPELFDEQEYYTGRTTYLNSTYFDEIYHARTAYEYIQGVYSYENTHPPLGKFFISLGIRAFGMDPFGWRIAGCLFGIAMLPFFYIFAKKMTKKSWLAAAVTTLFAFDFMHFTQTRIATIDVFVTFFIIVMYWLMYEYTKKSFYDQPLKKTFIPLGACGVVMGFAMASKWTGIYAAGGLAVIFFVNLFNRYREYAYAKRHHRGETAGISHAEIVRKFPEYTRKTILFCCIFFVVIPAVIYTLSYIPFNDNSGAGLLTRMINNQKTMFGYHSTLVSEHPFSSKWYQWPIMTRPIWYYSGHVSDTISEGISAFGNPLVWWAGIPAFIAMIYLAIAKKDKNAGFLIIAYMAQYLPWFFVSRTTYIYHYFPSVPFITLMIGYVFYWFVKNKPAKWKVATVWVYVAAAVGLFILFYPVLSGHGVDKEFVKHYLRWFESWVLVS